MANTVPSPYMNMQVPTPGVAPGPDWASILNECLLRIDQHDHTTNNGFALTSSSLNINSDLTFNNKNAYALRSVRFTGASGVNLAADIGCIYVNGGNLYYNNQSGTAVQITNGSGVVGAPGNIGGMTGTASVNYVPASNAYVFQSATNTAGFIDGRSFILRNGGASSFGLTLSPPSGMTADISMQFPPLPGSNSVMVLAPSGQMITQSYDAIGQAMSLTGANAIGSTMTSTGANAVFADVSTCPATQSNLIAEARTRTTGTPAAKGGVAISADSGSQNIITPGTYAITNSSVTIDTSGRPVFVGLICGTGQGTLSVVDTDSSASMNIRLRRNGTLIVNSVISGTANTTTIVGVGVPPSAINHIDVSLPAGTYTYTAEVFFSQGNVNLTSTRLVAYEI